WIEFSVEPNLPANATLLPASPILSNEPAALIKWNEIDYHWQVLQEVVGNGSNAINVVVPGTGAYALVARDFEPLDLRPSPFPPLLLLGSEELKEARVKVDVLAPGAFGGAVIETNGGQVASQNIRLLAGSGDLVRRQAAVLREIDPTNFVGLATASNEIVAA